MDDDDFDIEEYWSAERKQRAATVVNVAVGSVVVLGPCVAFWVVNSAMDWVANAVTVERAPTDTPRPRPLVEPPDARTVELYARDVAPSQTSGAHCVVFSPPLVADLLGGRRTRASAACLSFSEYDSTPHIWAAGYHANAPKVTNLGDWFPPERIEAELRARGEAYDEAVREREAARRNRLLPTR